MADKDDRTEASADFLHGGSEVAQAIRNRDWSATPLGSIETWPQSLRTTVSLCLASNFPINIIWGPERNQIYNDGYRVICGDAHPRSLGEDYRVTWRSAWPAIGDPFEQAVRGETSFLENQRMFLTRNGYLEETFFTFSLSPIRDESGGIGGLFHPVTETTASMLAERRTRTLRDVAAKAGATETVSDLPHILEEVLGDAQFDLPFVLFYELSPSASDYRLTAMLGIARDTHLSPDILAAEASAPWPVADAVRSSGKPLVTEGFAPSLSGVPCGPYDEPANAAVTIAMTVPGVDLPPLVVVIGISPRLPFDEAYRSFIDLLASTISGALRNARAREDERRRVEALAEIDRAKTAFFSNVSHEFRTPLTLMLSPLEEVLASDSALAEDQRERIAIAHRNGVRLLKLVNAMLDFSRTEAGRTEALFEETDLAAYTADLASNFRSVIEQAGLSLSVESGADIDPVFVDRDMWEKIVLNLLSNAFKFTHEGEIKVEVKDSSDGRSVEVAVSDTGIGVSAAELPKLFERFHRVEGANGRSFEGSGIGLALVRELVTILGGEISAESTPGEGTTFSIRLAKRSAHVPAGRIASRRATVPVSRARAFVEEAMAWLPDVSEAEQALPAAGDHSMLNGRILLADDNQDMRAYVARLLRAEGLAVEVASDGHEALRKVREAKPDLILSDVMMPNLNGFGLLDAIRSDEELADIPFILLSARAGLEARSEGLDAGADDYLTKPFSARELIARVSANLIRTRDRRVASLRELNRTLERRVAETTAELQETHERLRQGQKMEAIGTLTGGMAHDFNNLLTPIIGSLDLIQRRGLGDDRAKRMIEGAIASADKAKVLIQRLLAFARRQPLQVATVDLALLIEGMKPLIEGTVGSRTNIVYGIAPSLLPALLDANQLEMALLNLVVNARDAMPEGGTLTIGASNDTVGGEGGATAESFVTLYVRDTGVGMDRQTAEQATEPFFSTKGVGRGTGLGLSMVHGLVSQLGGRMEIVSAPGRGTTVELVLPAASRPEEPKPQERNGDIATAIALVVDDEPLVRMCTADAMSELGYSPVEAGSADEALKFVREGLSPDILVTDHMMPGKTGMDLARELRADWPDLPVLIVSGYAAAGAATSEFPRLSKPFRLSELADAVASSRLGRP